MFCPGCGSTNAIDQRYCRACGMNLQQASSSLIEQFPDGSRSDLQRQENRLEKFGNVAFSGFIGVVGLGIVFMLYTIATKFILSGDQPIAGVLLSLFIVFAGLTLAYVVRNESLKEQRKKIERAPGLNSGTNLPSPEQGLLEETRLEPISSVIEDTTKHLGVEKSTKKLG